MVGQRTVAHRQMHPGMSVVGLTRNIGSRGCMNFSVYFLYFLYSAQCAGAMLLGGGVRLRNGFKRGPEFCTRICIFVIVFFGRTIRECGGLSSAKLSVTLTSFGGQSDGVSNYNVGFSAGAARTLRVSSSGIIPDARRSVWGDCRQGQHVADGGCASGTIPDTPRRFYF
jgi:hypothetical protein